MAYDEKTVKERLSDFELPSEDSNAPVELIKDAIEGGMKYQQKILDNIKQIQLLITAESKNWLSSPNLDTPTYQIVGGVDGSFFPIPSLAGYWYTPFSIAMISFESLQDATHIGLNVKSESDFFHPPPKATQVVEGFSSYFESIPMLIRRRAAQLMLYGETRAIELITDKLPANSMIFIDGPVVDPPAGAPLDLISKRVEAIKTAWEKNIIIVGIVKRIHDSYLSKRLFEERWAITNWYSFNMGDRVLMSPLFDQYREEFDGFDHKLFTPWMDTSTETQDAVLYNLRGLKRISGLYQSARNTGLTRIEVFVRSSVNDDFINTIWDKVKIATGKWTYPGHSWPVPVIAAHENCKISKEMAITLHQEFISKLVGGDQHAFSSIYSLMLNEV
ncbi:MAG: hypothetical protein HeimC3_48550 [Candidatus Heimdallarchaeota archaeon LC_3]|nr:MAG: hypothetical protein HeimC3_48550 [Candidatus Heimdallarchaeota archaeon LC_3]